MKTSSARDDASGVARVDSRSSMPFLVFARRRVIIMGRKSELEEGEIGGARDSMPDGEHEASARRKRGGECLRRGRCIHCSLNSASPSYYRRRCKYQHRLDAAYVRVRARDSRGNAWAPHTRQQRRRRHRARARRATKKSIYHFRTSRAHKTACGGDHRVARTQTHVPARAALSTDGLLLLALVAMLSRRWIRPAAEGFSDPFGGFYSRTFLGSDDLPAFPVSTRARDQRLFSLPSSLRLLFTSLHFYRPAGESLEIRRFVVHGAHRCSGYPTVSVKRGKSAGIVNRSSAE